MVDRSFLSRTLLFVALALLCCAGLVQAGPKYVFFFIGDGMGPEQIKAGGMYANGAAGTLSFESFPHQGQLTTYSADNPVTDSAAAGTALATGFKVNNGVVSMAYPGDGHELETLLEWSKFRYYKRSGLVTTTYIEHATPATFGAHEPSRDNLSQIANDLLTQTRPNIMFGGATNMGGAGAAGYTVVTNRAGMQALDPNAETMVSGQFGNTYMPYEYDGMGALPHLSEMAVTAIDILDNEPNGMFVMIEGGLVDQACHSNDNPRMVHEVVELSNSVQKAIDWVNARGETDFLILVAADHETGGLTVVQNNGQGNYPTVTWSTTGHTATNVRVFAWGVNSEMISGVMNNTDMWGVVTADTKATSPSPANGATQVAINAVLSWTAGTKAVSHDVYFGTSPTPPFVQNQTATTFDPNLSPSTVYYWRIDEVNDLDPASPWVGDVWTFTTAAVPGQASNPNPANGATGVSTTADLSWTAGSSTTSHDVYLGTNQTAVENANTGSPEFKGNQTATTYDPGTMSSSQTYYWRIDEVGPGGTTKGVVWSFTTREPPVTYYPGSYSVYQGTYSSGNVASLTANDNNYLVINSQTSGTIRYATTDFTVTGITAGSPSQIDVQVITKSSRSNTSQKVYLYNFGTAAWDQKDSANIGTKEVTRNIAVTSGMSNYISAGQLKVRTEGSKTNRTSFSFSHELLSVTITP